MSEENKLIPYTNMVVDHIRWKINALPWMFAFATICAAVMYTYDNIVKYLHIHNQPTIPVLIYGGNWVCEAIIIKNKYVLTSPETGLKCTDADLAKIEDIAKNADFSNYDVHFPITLMGIGESLFYACVLALPFYCLLMFITRDTRASLVLSIPAVAFMAAMVIFGAKSIHLPEHAVSSAILYKDGAYCGWNSILTIIWDDTCHITNTYNIERKYEIVKQL